MNGPYHFFHPDCTVGSGIAPDQLALVDFYHRSGIGFCLTLPRSIELYLSGIVYRSEESVNTESDYSSAKDS